MTWEEIRTFLLHSYVLGPLVFIIWCIVAFLLKGILFGQLHRATKKTSLSRYQVMVNALNVPLNLIIPFIGLSLVWKFIPLNPTFEFYMDLLTMVVIILSVTLLVDRFIHGLLIEHDKTTNTVKLAKGLLGGLIRAVIYIIGIFIILDTLGVSITPLIASLGIGTLAVALALQSTLANFFSGLFVMMDRSITVGDFVQLESGEMGFVDEIGWRASRIRLLTNNHVIIPNAKLVDSVVTNYQAPEPMMYILVTVGVHYDSDLEQVEKVVMEVAQEVIDDIEGTVKDEAPTVWFREFDDSSITFRVRVGCKDFVSQFLIQHELIKRIHRRFAKEGIVIPFPLTTLDIQPKHVKLLRELTGRPHVEE